MKCSISWDPGTSYSGFPGQNTLDGTLDHLHLHEFTWGETKLSFALENPKFTRVLFPVFFHLINEKQAGCLSYIGFRTTQCLGILISRYQDPIIGQPVECNNVFFSLLQLVATVKKKISAQLEGDAASDIQIAIYRCFQGVSLPKTNNVFSYLGDMNHHLSRSPSCAITKEPNPLTTVYTINIPCRPHRNVQWWNIVLSLLKAIRQCRSHLNGLLVWRNPWGIQRLPGHKRTHPTDSIPHLPKSHESHIYLNCLSCQLCIRWVRLFGDYKCPEKKHIYL